MKKKIGVDRCGYIFIAPYYIFFLMFVLFPIAVSIGLSFTDFNLKSISFIGFENYRTLISDSLYWISVKNTLIYVVFTVFFTMILGLFLAIALKSASIWGTKFFRGIIYMPYVTSMVAMSMVWLWLYDPTHGIVNVLIEKLGFSSQQWLYDEKLALGAIIVMGVWKGLGYYMTLFLAGLYNIPGYLYEAAEIDGANAVQCFWKITLPMLRPVTFFILITGVINAFNVFEQVNVMTGGGPMNATTTIVHQIYIRAFTEYKMGYGAAEAVVLLIIVFVFTMLNFRYGNQGEDLDIG
ncbi:MAG: sugar ABC transporter permease [Blautia sp.]|jgi:ABC-type sugar transport system permease subunit